MHGIADVLGVRAALTRRASAVALSLALTALPLAALPAGAVRVPARPSLARPAVVRSGVAAPRTLPAAHLPAPPGRTRLESVRVGGGPSGGASIEPSLSRDGRWLAFASGAADLVAGDTNGAVDVFLRDRRTGSTVRIPLPGGAAIPTGGGAREPAISGDGRYVAFTYQPPTSGLAAAPGSVVLVWDRTTNATVVGSRKTNGAPAPASAGPALSRDGRYLAFVSRAPDVVADDVNEAPDVFRIAWQGSGRPVLVSVGFDGPESAPGTSGSPAISGDGSVIAFESDAGDGIVDADTGAGMQVYVRDLAARTTTQVSVDRTGAAPDGAASGPSISADGRRIAFASAATDLVAGDTNAAPDVFVRDRVAGTTTLASVAVDGAATDGASAQPAISADGHIVVFTSLAEDLVAAAPTRGITLAAVAPGRSEVYARDLVAGETIRISVALAGGPGGRQSFEPVVSTNGRYVAFTSTSGVLTDDPDNERHDVFVRDLPPVAVVLPPTIAFGSQAVSVPAAPGAATVANTGWSPLTVRELELTGAARADYAVLADGCTDASLRREHVCTITLGFTPTRRGNRVARLEIRHTASGSPATVVLRGGGSLARVTLDPPIGSPGIVTVAEGTGFPAGAVIRLRWDRGITPKLADVTADADGAFRVQVLVFHHDLLGDRRLVATSVGGDPFPETGADMTIVPGQGQPPTFALLRLLRILPAVIVFRR